MDRICQGVERIYIREIYNEEGIRIHKMICNVSLPFWFQLLLALCGSKEKYRYVKDLHNLRSRLAHIQYVG